MIYLDESESAYKYTVLRQEEPEEVRAHYPVSEFRNREHFAGVIGKFMPHVWILDEAHEVEISEPSLEELLRVEDILNKRVSG